MNLFGDKKEDEAQQPQAGTPAAEGAPAAPEAPEKKEEVTEAQPVEEKKEEAKKPPKGDNPLKKEKIEEDKSNEGSFFVGDKMKIKGMEFAVKEVKGLELILKRTDIL